MLDNRIRPLHSLDFNSLDYYEWSLTGREPKRPRHDIDDLFVCANFVIWTIIKRNSDISVCLLTFVAKYAINADI